MHAINWFEIPVNNFEKAKKFYDTVIGVEIRDEMFNHLRMGVFPTDNTSQTTVSGAIVKGEHYEPSDKGSLVYLNGGEDLQVMLARVESAGGKVIVPKMHIGEKAGYMAVFQDTEGNHVALHSWN
ncbi:MAG: VOC family protein [Rhizobacter sp.]|nr:VOC family protein [Chlorobiales bacterium]